MFEFLVLVDGQQATAVYDSSSSVSYVTLRWLKSLGMKCCSKQRAFVVVETSSGSFTCSVDLFSHPGSEIPDVMLGGDWFNYCTSACQNVEIPLIDGSRVVFAKSVPGMFSFHYFRLVRR
jgi:hypothetical protein